MSRHPVAWLFAALGVGIVVAGAFVVRGARRQYPLH